MIIHEKLMVTSQQHNNLFWFTLLSLIISSTALLSQRNQIIGKVIDDKSGQSVPFATVSVFSANDS
ncbi:MAG: hypothetical protein ACK5B6_10675, partial [Bacteroidia bacterium]